MLDVENSVLVVIDVQEKLVKAALNGDLVAANTNKIVKAANILSIPTIVTEQYPKGLGTSVFDMQRANIIEKTSFSAYKEPEFKSLIDKIGKKQVILCGIEAHICVLQTAIDLLQNGYEIHVLKDCVSSRNEFELNTGIELLKSYGVKISCLEIALFGWLKTSKHPNFKELQALIK